VRSAELTLVLVGAGVLALLAAGCDSTQQKSARLQIQAERLLAAREKVVVTRTPSCRRSA